MTIPMFTICTPAYNGAHTLFRVYNSLKSQTLQDFEWIVIDDGSIDNTAEIIGRWQSEADFSIVYHYQPNSGKPVAFNRGVKMARGELFLIIDHDDAFLPESLESMLNWWRDIPVAERDEFTGIVTLCQFEDGNLCSQPFPTSPLDTNSLDLRFKYKVRGETWGFHRTTVLKAYPFPEDPSTRYIPENIIWDDIARNYKIRCINEPLRIFYQDAGVPLSNRISNRAPHKKALHKNYILHFLNRDFDYFRHDPITFSKWAVLYVRYSLHLRDWSFFGPVRFNSAGAFALVCLALVPGTLVYLADRLKIRI